MQLIKPLLQLSEKLILGTLNSCYFSHFSKLNYFDYTKNSLHNFIEDLLIDGLRE